MGLVQGRIWRTSGQSRTPLGVLNIKPKVNITGVFGFNN